MIKSQADQRRNQNMKDQHGRSWFASIEKASGYPTGLVQPLFDAPHPRLVPPPHYLVFNPDEPGKVYIDYDRWIGEQEAACKAWDEQRIRTGHMIHGASFNPNGPTPPELVIILGERPLSPVPIKAMQQGNRWALGFTDVRPPEADQFFPLPDRAPASLAFTETAPVFEEPATPLPGIPVHDLAGQLAAVEARCPEKLTGSARSAWVMAELRKAAAVQPQEA